MYLSRLWLNPRSRDVRRDLGDPQEMHRTVMRAFPKVERASEAARAFHGVLHRIDDDRRMGRLVLYVQSNSSPDWRVLSEGYLIDTGSEVDNPATTALDDAWNALSSGMVLGFRLRANPTRKVGTKTGPDGRRRNGRRVGHVGDADRLGWLARKAGEAGFELLATEASPDVPDVLVVDERNLIGRRREEKKLTFTPALFEGRLRVTDADAFRAALAAGIGPGKAFGFGLLSIQRAR